MEAIVTDRVFLGVMRYGLQAFAGKQLLKKEILKPVGRSSPIGAGGGAEKATHLDRGRGGGMSARARMKRT